MPKKSRRAHFSPELFTFLRDLSENNEREWFAENKKRYEAAARDPLLSFIADLGGPLRSVSPHLTADPRPTGGSMFRIYRDIRFSKDKSPYKTHLAARFPHSASKTSCAPGFYLSLQAGGAYAAGGLWRPDPKSLAAIRQAIVDEPRKWQAVRKKVKVEGDRLKRPPRGFDADHPLVEDLKFKDFVGSTPFTEAQACSPGFLFDFVDACKRIAPLTAFLCRALDLEW